MTTSLFRFVALAFLFTTAALAQVARTDEAAKRWAQYESSFAAFAEADRAHPPAKGGILVVGSSIFRQWTNVAEQMAPLPVLNRAFGGSRTSDQLARFDQVVLPYAPKVILYYCGSNDLKMAQADSPDVIFERFRAFSQRVRAVLPETRVIYVSSTRSPDRVERWEQVDRYNALALAYCAATPHHTYIDINPALVDAEGRPRLALYKADKLHFHPESYDEFARIIKPVLNRVWADANTAAKTKAAR